MASTPDTTLVPTTLSQRLTSQVAYRGFVMLLMMAALLRLHTMAEVSGGLAYRD